MHDPLLDPKIGDAVRASNGKIRSVVKRNGTDVWYSEGLEVPISAEGDCLCLDKTWRAWCRKWKAVVFAQGLNEGEIISNGDEALDGAAWHPVPARSHLIGKPYNREKFSDIRRRLT
jgi:hypothetical protein